VYRTIRQQVVLVCCDDQRSITDLEVVIVFGFVMVVVFVVDLSDGNRLW
jgi:hypothetical protein